MKSVKTKLSLISCGIILAIIIFLVVINNFVLRDFFFSENGIIGVYGLVIIVLTAIIRLYYNFLCYKKFYGAN